jgi:hypothetical protein
LEEAAALTASRAAASFSPSVWVAALREAGAAGRIPAWDAARLAARQAVEQAVGDAFPYARGAAVDAAQASVVQDLIPPDMFKAMVAPWGEVVGPAADDDSEAA